MKKRIAARLVSYSGLGRLFASLLPSTGILVLNYHRVGDGTASPHDRALWSAGAEAFDKQIGLLARHFDVISPEDFESAAKRRGRHVMITFDDGYLDNYEVAFPILRRHRVPATFFVSTGFIDRPALPWWDEIAWLLRGTARTELDLRPWFEAPLRLDAKRQPQIQAVLRRFKALEFSESRAMLAALREASGLTPPKTVARHWMDWNMIREMSANGMTIGGHTVNHPVLSRLTRERQREEIEGCAARILAETGRPMEYFAYPVGNRWAFNDDTVACLEAAGVRRAFSYYGGEATPASPRFDTPRVAVEPHVELPDLDAMLRLPRIFCGRDPE
jgi:peptidoglycan/xylan/chitin deacetylase (PgdA/CDA1 family)